MEPAPPCPLPPALLRLLQAAADAGTTNATTLAGKLWLSKSTVRTEWQRIHEVLGVHCRYAAVALALRNGWITAPPPYSPRIMKVSSAVCFVAMAKMYANAVFTR